MLLNEHLVHNTCQMDGSCQTEERKKCAVRVKNILHLSLPALLVFLLSVLHRFGPTLFINTKLFITLNNQIIQTKSALGFKPINSFIIHLPMNFSCWILQWDMWDLYFFFY